MTQQIHPVILSGGAGTRLWPLSRRDHPKQLIPLIGDLSPFAQTLKRVADPAFGRPLVISNQAYRFLIADEAANVGVDSDIVLEPEGRDSAPAILAAAAILKARDPEALVLILPSDHHIPNAPAFRDAIIQGAAAASAGMVVTFGITPTRPETGYGYIRKGAGIDDAAPALHVDSFIEKPDASRALTLLQEGCLWNSGMFLFSAAKLLEIAAALQPDIIAAVNSAVGAIENDLNLLRLGDDFLQSPAISFDHAIMEKTDRAAVVPVSFPWSDIGTWEAVWQESDQDGAGNSTMGDVILNSVNNSFVRSEGPLTVVAGIDDVNVVVTTDAVLVSARAASGQVKEIAAELGRNQRSEAVHHRRCYRPWGWYESLQMGERFQVKRISVKPGHKLSLQKHRYRAEHWVVVRGLAEVTIDDNVARLEENQSTYIPIGAIHRLANPTAEPVEIIEIQTGTYFGEDDIIRFGDDYGRGNDE